MVAKRGRPIGYRTSNECNSLLSRSNGGRKRCSSTHRDPYPSVSNEKKANHKRLILLDLNKPLLETAMDMFDFFVEGYRHTAALRIAAELGRPRKYRCDVSQGAGRTHCRALYDERDCKRLRS